MLLKSGAKKCLNALIHFVYPSFCAHCQKEPVAPRQLFCPSCQPWLEPAPVGGEESCRAVAFERFGLAETLLRLSRQSPIPSEVTQTLVSLMVYQFLAFKWPIPDVIVPAPGCLGTKAMAKGLGDFFSVPCIDCLQSETHWKWMRRPLEGRVLVVEIDFSKKRNWEVLNEAGLKKIDYGGFR